MVVSVHVAPLPAPELRLAVCSLLPAFVSPVLLKRSPARSFTSCLWLCSCCNSRAESWQQRPRGLQTRILPGPLQVCHPLPQTRVCTMLPGTVRWAALRGAVSRGNPGQKQGSDGTNAVQGTPAPAHLPSHAGPYPRAAKGQ